MNIYYAAAIRGANEVDNSDLNKMIIESLQKQGHNVLTEHISDDLIRIVGELNMTDKEIHDRDMKWVAEADLVIAEVSNPSLGVGYEIGRAIEMGKQILCLCKTQANRLSAMVRGSDRITVTDYKTPGEAIRIINEYLNLL
jgi:nucleoside 2-deoxyribosyltransferase